MARSSLSRSVCAVLAAALPVVISSCGSGGSGGSPTPIGNEKGARVAAVHQGRLVDVYGLHTDGGNRVIELYRADVLVGPDIQDQRNGITGNKRDDEILYDFLGANPDTLQNRLLITREIGSTEFDAAFDDLDENLRLVAPGQAGRNARVAPYSVVARNAAIRVTFTEPLGITDDFFYDKDENGAVTGFKNTRAVQLLRIVGDPNDNRHEFDFQQLDARIAVRDNVLIIDPVLLGTEGLVYGSRNSAAGMPMAPDQVRANMRIALALDGPLRIPGLKQDRDGKLSGRNLGAIPSVIRDFRSGNPADNSPEISRGFLRDAEPPRLVGHMKMLLDTVEKVTADTRLIKIYKDGVTHELDRGDLVRLQLPNARVPIASLEILADPEDDLGKPNIPYVRALVRPVVGPNGEDVLEQIDPSNDPDCPASGEARREWLREHGPRAILIAEFTHRRKKPNTKDEYYGDDPRNFLAFSPSPIPNGATSVRPNEFVSPFAAAIVRFSKPIDMDSVLALDTLFFGTRDVLSDDAFDNWVKEREKALGIQIDSSRINREKFKTPHLIHSRIYDENGTQTTVRVQPTMGFYLDEVMREAAAADALLPFAEQRFHYFLHLVAANGITDLSGNALDLQSEPVSGEPVGSHVVMEFSIDTRLRAGSNEPLYEDNIVAYIVRRFADKDEDAKPNIYLPEELTLQGDQTPAAGAYSADFFGGIYLASGELTSRLGSRIRRVADDVNQIAPPPQNSNLRWCPETGPTAFASPRQIVNITGAPAFGQPIQNPLNPHGCRLQTVWRELDMSLSRTDPADFDLDVEQMYWAPFGANPIYFDEFDQMSLFLGHSEWRPEVCIASGSAFPTFPQSGLKTLFSENYLANKDQNGGIEHKPLPHPAFVDKTLTINPREAFFEPRNVNRYLPLPKFEDATKRSQLRDKLFVWRNQLEMGQGGNNGVHPDATPHPVRPYPFLLSPFRGGKGDAVVGPKGNTTFDDGHWHSCLDLSLSNGQPEYITGGTVGSIALPMMADFWVYPDSAEKPVYDPFLAAGINGWQVSLTVTSAPDPNFRVYSAGRASDRVGPHHRWKWTRASGGYDKDNQATRPGDNTFYWMMADFLKRTTVVTSGFVEIKDPHRMTRRIAPHENLTSSVTDDPRLGPFDVKGMLPNYSVDFEPPLSQLPAGTSIVTEFRGASDLDRENQWWPRTHGNPPTEANFPCDPLKAGDAHIRKWDDRAIPGTSTSRRWWTYLYNRTVTTYTEDPNDLSKTAFTNTFSGPNESFTAADVRYLNWRFVMKNNVDISPPVSPKIQSFALSYRFQKTTR